MVGSIIGGGQSQTPASAAFSAGQAPQNPADTAKVNTAPQAKNVQDASLSPGKTEEISSKLALSREQSRVPPNQVFNNNQERGSILDITV